MTKILCPACKIFLEQHSLSQELNCLNFILEKMKNSEGQRFDPKPSEPIQSKGLDDNG